MIFAFPKKKMFKSSIVGFISPSGWLWTQPLIEGSIGFIWKKIEEVLNLYLMLGSKITSVISFPLILSFPMNSLGCKFFEATSINSKVSREILKMYPLFFKILNGNLPLLNYFFTSLITCFKISSAMFFSVTV